LGEAGTYAFTIMRLMGHSTVTVSQRYVHPSPEAVELALERLEDLNLQKVGTSIGTPEQVAIIQELYLLHRARVAKSADATDLKSVFRQRECGFNSHPGHHIFFNVLPTKQFFIGTHRDIRVE
jgi:hypothetical protein